MAPTDADEVAVDADAAARADLGGEDLDRPRRGAISRAVLGAEVIALGWGEAVQVGLAAPMVVVLAVVVEQRLKLFQRAGRWSFPQPLEHRGVGPLVLPAGLGVGDRAGAWCYPQG